MKDEDKETWSEFVRGCLAFICYFGIIVVVGTFYEFYSRVMGLIFGYGPEVIGRSASRSVRYDAEKDEMSYECVCHRYILYRDRLGRGRIVTQILSPWTDKVKGKTTPYFHPRFEDVQRYTGETPKEVDGMI
jgi:hypothetical protein